MYDGGYYNTSGWKDFYVIWASTRQHLFSYIETIKCHINISVQSTLRLTFILPARHIQRIYFHFLISPPNIILMIYPLKLKPSLSSWIFYPNSRYSVLCEFKGKFFMIIFYIFLFSWFALTIWVILFSHVGIDN